MIAKVVSRLEVASASVPYATPSSSAHATVSGAEQSLAIAGRLVLMVMKARPSGLIGTEESCC